MSKSVSANGQLGWTGISTTTNNKIMIMGSRQREDYGFGKTSGLRG